MVHVTTPPTSHYPLAMAALDAGAHVILEKPATVTFDQLEDWSTTPEARARPWSRTITTSTTAPTRKILGLIESGDFGDVTHVEVFICLDIARRGVRLRRPELAPPLPLDEGRRDRRLPDPPGLPSTPSSAPIRKVSTTWSKRSPGPLPSDEMRALVVAERGSALLAFSANTQPDAFWLRVYGTRMQATADLFETRLSIRRVRGGPKPLRPLFNSLDEAQSRPEIGVGTLVAQARRRPGFVRRALGLARRDLPGAGLGRGHADHAAARSSRSTAWSPTSPRENTSFEGPHHRRQRVPGPACRRPVLRSGHAVRALVRPASQIDRFPWADEVEVFRGRPAGLAQPGLGVRRDRRRVHLAAGVKGSEDAQFAASVVGTERLLDAMAQSETRRLVLASSFSVYDWSAIRGELTEDSPVEPPGDLYDRDGYAVAKVWQERVARRMAAEHGWELDRPPAGLHLGSGQRIPRRPGPEIRQVPPGLRPFDPPASDPRRQLRHAFAEATENPRAIGRDVQYGRR